MVKLFNDHFQNFKKYNIPKAQLVIADIPYNIGKNAYASNPQWYIDGKIENGDSDKAGKIFFDTDYNFRISEFLFYASRMLNNNKKEPPAILVFCSFEQQFEIIEKAKKEGLKRYINLVFHKSSSPQALKTNLKIVSNAEYGLILYKERLPKFRNNGKMIMNIIDYERDSITNPLYRKIHPTQKPVKLLERLIKIFTDEGDVIIDPVAGSGSTLIASNNLNRNAYGFEKSKEFYEKALDWIELNVNIKKEIEEFGFAKIDNEPTLFD